MIMGSIIFVLLVVVSIQTPQISQADDIESEAVALAQSAKDLLRAVDVRCTARDTDFAGIRRCIEPVLLKNDFELDDFQRFDDRRNETGAFIIRNEGVKTYNGSLFVMTKNGEEVAQGCHITSDILQDYTCRFDISEACRTGDVFEISYEESRLITRTC